MSASSRRTILFFFCAASVLISFNISALTAVIPAISRSLNVSANDAAGIIAWYMIPYGACALFYAPLASRFSIKSLMIAACLLYGLGNWVSLWSNDLTILLAGRVIAGLGAAAVTPLALMTLGKIFEKHKRGRVIGLFFASSFFGSMLGLILSAAASWHWLLICPALGGVLLGAALMLCPKEGMEPNIGTKVNYLEAFQMGGLRRILIFIFFISLFFHSVCKWYGVYLDQIYGYSQATISLLIIFSSLAAGFGQILGGWITDKMGRAASCVIGITILGGFIALLLGHYPLIVMGLIMAMISVGWTILHNGISTVLTDFSTQYRAELAALNSAVRFFSGGVGFWISGSFVQQNFGLTFFTIGCLILAQALFIKYIVPKS